MPADLAPVYLDGTRVTLQGDPRPQVAKILLAGGRPAGSTVRLEGAAGGARTLGADEVVDRTGTTLALHLRTMPAISTGLPATAGDKAVGGKVQVPGEILRGTETRSGAANPSTPSANPPATQRFAESQSFADPVHKGGSPSVAADSEPSAVPSSHRGGIPDGGLRTQESGSQEGARTARRGSTTTTSRGSLGRISEEE